MHDSEVQAALLEMSRSIGGLDSTVKLLVSTWQQQETAASQGRRDLHVKVDAVRDDVKVMGSQLATAIADIAKMSPDLRAFRPGARSDPHAGLFYSRDRRRNCQLVGGETLCERLWRN